MQSTKQITLKYGISRQAFKIRANAKGVKAIKKKGTVCYYKKPDIDKVLKGFVPIDKFTDDRKKIVVIETYFGLGSQDNISFVLGISNTFVKKTIKEFKDTGYITIKSKL